jgi:hypothetical protein
MLGSPAAIPATAHRNASSGREAASEVRASSKYRPDALRLVVK